MPRILRPAEFLQKSHLLRRPRCHEDAQIVGARIGRMHEEAVALTAVAERCSKQRFAVVERDGHLAALRTLPEFLAIATRLITGEVAHEEQRLQLRELQEERIARIRLRREMQLWLGWMEICGVAADEVPVAETRHDLLPPPG